MFENNYGHLKYFLKHPKKRLKSDFLKQRAQVIFGGSVCPISNRCNSTCDCVTRKQATFGRFHSTWIGFLAREVLFRNAERATLSLFVLTCARHKIHLEAIYCFENTHTNHKPSGPVLVTTQGKPQKVFFFFLYQHVSLEKMFQIHAKAVSLRRL